MSKITCSLGIQTEGLYYTPVTEDFTIWVITVAKGHYFIIVNGTIPGICQHVCDE